MEQKINYMSAADAVKLIESGDHIYVMGSTAIPEILMDALADRGRELHDVTVYSALSCRRGINQLLHAG